MLQQRGFLMVIALSCILQARGADKYTDENRPYEFGFTIDGEQHRHEKKDENGIIMGEFGFITADGVYHVTVYATDENGNFKILSMKNIRVKPYPTAPGRESHALPFPPSKNPPQTQGPSNQNSPSAVAAPSPAAPAKTCSHCSLPTTTTRRPEITDLAQVSRDQNQFGTPGNTNSRYPEGQGQNYPQGAVGQNYPQQGTGQNYPRPGEFGQNYPQGGGSNYPQGGGANYPQSGSSGQNYPETKPDSQQEQNFPKGSGSPQNYPQNSGLGTFNSPGQALQTPFTNSDRNPKQFTDYPQQPFGGQQSGQFGPPGAQNPPKPTLISAQMQIVDKNTDIYQKQPGEKDGLPDGLTKDDMVQLLYTFNYTVGFHGHFEEGYTNGAKQGYYYVTGRNGVRTRVDYVADEKGFRPKITQEVLDLLSDDVPKPETEKDEKYGLKGYEFKWLYYPVDSRRSR